MNERKTTDNRLLEQAIAEMGKGSTEALAQLYEQTKTAVYAYALSIAADAHTAEDVMQETYLRAFAAAARYAPMGKPMAWLLTITKNLALMKLREGKRQTEGLDEAIPSPAFEGSALTRLSLRAAMAALSEQEREIVALHAVAGLKHREIAALLKLPTATVLSKYHRALSKLKEILKEEG